MTKVKLLPAALLVIVAIGFIVAVVHGLRTPGKPLLPENGIAASEDREDDPEARLRYDWMRLHDPATGVIPADMRRKELAFASGLPTVDDLALRTTQKSAGGTAIQSTVWNWRGPTNLGGRTRALAVDAHNASIILAGGVSGGMWRSVNGGATWTRATTPAQLPSATCIAQDTRTGHEGTWYYGTGEYLGNSANGGGNGFYNGDGVYKSTDNGVSWTLLSSTSVGTPQSFTSPFDYVWDVAADPSVTTADIVYAACYGVIERSTNGGTSWAAALGAFGAGASAMTDVRVTSTGVLYAAGSFGSSSTMNGVWRSTDGTHWTNITPATFPTSYGRIVIGVAPSNESIVYFVVQGTNGTNGVDQINNHQFWKYAYVSGDGSGAGGTWTNRGVNLPNESGLSGNAMFDTQNGYDMLVRVKPDDPNFVIVGSTNLYRSTDAFATSTNWTRIGGYASPSTYNWYTNSHPDHHSGAFVTGSSVIFLAGHDEGVSKTTDVTASTVAWTSLDNAYGTTQFYGISLDHATSGNAVLIGGMQDNGSWFTNSTSSSVAWVSLLGGDGTTSAIADGRSSYYVSAQNGLTYRMLLNGSGGLTNFTRVDPTGGSGYLFVNPFVLDPSNTNVMYFSGGASLWCNSDLTGIALGSSSTTSTNWTNLTAAGISGSVISALGVSRSTPSNRLYYGSRDGKVYRLDNATSATSSTTSTDIWTGKGFPVGAYVSCVAVDPTNGDRAMVAFSNYSVLSLYYTTNAGSNWTAVAGNLEQNPDGSGDGPSVRWAAILPAGATTYYYAGTSTGLYSTQTLNGTSTVWALEGASSMGNIVVDKIDTRQSDGLVVVATHGGGVYSGTVSPNAVSEEPVPVYARLLGNYPNPFNPSTTIRFSLDRASDIRLKIYSVDGQLVASLFAGRMAAGEHSVVWRPDRLASGVYVCRLEGGSFTASRRLVLMK